MLDSNLNVLWDNFLSEWPAERVRSMSLEEYTNLNRSDAFVYWIERTTEELGSIRGGSAFKWGIYQRKPGSNKPGAPGTSSDETYSWYKRYGNTAEEAFRTIRERLVEVIEAIQQGDLERIDGTEVCWPMVKWKVAFLYQDRQSPHILPVFRDDKLFDHYRLAAPGAKRKDVTRAVMYPTLLDRYRDRGDIFEIARVIWGEGEKPNESRYWALPLHVAISADEAKKLCKLPEVNPEDLPSLVHEMLVDTEVRVGDEVALLVGDTVKAVGNFVSAEPEVYAWTQQPVEINPDLTVIPARVVELDASERESIWGELEQESPPGEVQYWKISPGQNAHLWQEWKTQGYVAIGWDKFGDVSRLDRAGFERRMRELQEEDGYGSAGPRQVWRFRQIPVGSKIIANQGTGKLLGIGTVTGPYEYHPEDGEYCHRLPVHWDDLTERVIDRGGWRRTLIQLDESEFNNLLAPPVSELQGTLEAKTSEPKAGKCPEPQSIILFGPPGTGKTWTTITRALQLIFSEEEVKTWTDDTRARQFRELQRKGRIEFVTFHQAYGYEEFVEGIRPVMSEDATEQVRYELHPGVFKRISLRAAADGLREKTGSDSSARFTMLWHELMNQIDNEEIITAKGQQGNTYTLTKTKRGNLLIYRAGEDGDEGDDNAAGQTASENNVQLLWNNKETLGPVDQWTYQAVSDIFRSERNTSGGHHYTAYWIAMKLLEEIGAELPANSSDRQSDHAQQVQEALDRPQGGTVDFRFNEQTQPYVLIIDEINRGNVSKILGELITLLEPDKRLGASNELKLPLAYSPHHRFAVPQNLHVIGTMNTADRSIALMDVALRRRFRFEEMLPQSDVIRKVLRDHVSNTALIDLVCEVFDTMNARIRQVLDRDHQIGHAYFLKVRNLGDLRNVFADRIIPLLQEYFYGAWDRVCIVLGCPYDEDGTPLRSGVCIDSESRGYRSPIVEAVIDDNQSVLGFGSDEYESSVDLQITDTFGSAIGRPKRADEDLVEYFLGLLNLAPEEWSQWESAYFAGAPE